MLDDIITKQFIKDLKMLCDSYFCTKYTEFIFKEEDDLLYFSIDYGRVYTRYIGPLNKDVMLFSLFNYAYGYQSYYYDNVYK